MENVWQDTAGAATTVNQTATVVGYNSSTLIFPYPVSRYFLHDTLFM